MALSLSGAFTEVRHPLRDRVRAHYNTAMNPPDLHLILGGARSGKSAYAEQLASDAGQPVTYLATARIGDAEFAARVALHRERRPAGWGLVETPLALAEAFSRADGPQRVILIDCLTLWLANLLCPPDGDAPQAGWQTALDRFVEALPKARARVLIVSNEIGLGVVPMGALTRQYVDELGRLNQRMAALCPAVTLMVAGVPLAIKAPPPEFPADLYRHN
jgi:adenosylcobinamide kinase / adenosylcobinamide-phosphate guanylyltransferase